MEYIRSHALQKGLSSLELLRSRSDHEGKRLFLRSHDATRDWSVSEDQAKLLSFLCKFGGGVRVDSTRIANHGVLGSMLEDATFLLERLFDMFCCR